MLELIPTIFADYAINRVNDAKDLQHTAISEEIIIALLLIMKLIL